MPLKKLLAALQPRKVIGPVDRTVESIAYDSRRVQGDSMFVALRGEKVDGHQFIGAAIEKGASVIVTEREEACRATCVVVDNTRTALADLAVAFYENPARKLKLAGVTGTNGKTTTTFLIKHICESAGMRCGLLGTVRYEIGERILPAVRTTPESLDVQELLAQMRSAGCKAAAMEVSSHALEQERVRGIEWDVAVFTNLTQDHLDFHGTMEAYFDAKAKLFTGLTNQQYKKKAAAVVNVDDRYGDKLLERIGKETPVITYGSGLRANFRMSNYRSEFTGTSFQL
ncbi:MAG: Mur ligase family protein, partial [Chthoniobacterales bacterium]